MLTLPRLLGITAAMAALMAALLMTPDARSALDAEIEHLRHVSEADRAA